VCSHGIAARLKALESPDPVLNLFQHHAIRNLKGTDNNGRSLNGDGNPPGLWNDRADKNIGAQTSLGAEDFGQGFDVSETVLQRNHEPVTVDHCGDVSSH